MCYAIPGRVKEILEKTVLVDYFGEERKAHNEIDGLTVGDYIYAQGGYVIEKIPAPEAEEILAVWKETFFELQEVDLRLSRLDLETKGIGAETVRILDRAMEGKPPAKEELLQLLRSEDPTHLDLVFKTANFLRQKYLKNACCVHGILEISNHCKQGCHYCGISLHHKALPRYRMTQEEILAAVQEAVKRYGFKALVLQSGEDPGHSVEELEEIIRTIGREFPALIFISFGEIGIDNLKRLYDAGARGFLMRFETSNPELYAKLHPGQTLATRLEHLRKAYEMGYLIITGGLVGLPGQTLEDIVNDIYLARELHAEMFSFGPFLPSPGTPLAGFKPVNESEMLKVIAGARLVEPTEARVLITTAFETLSKEARRKGLLAGGNSVMLNVTPRQYREKYALYPDRAGKSELIQTQIDETIALLGSLGRSPTDLGAK
ncbi:MAG: hypothetical protein A2351_04825 [Omnitrophica bacterium RIFOXYB12_FULL_50_7]|nr:MAG: hypothetical protein A2351_04825 [Omnitrophica bacterium RIFOXYB12_FULL_50_7]